VILVYRGGIPHGYLSYNHSIPVSNEVVEADTVNAFKYRLDKHWSNQDVLFDFNADLTGTGSVPICM